MTSTKAQSHDKLRASGDARRVDDVVLAVLEAKPMAVCRDALCTHLDIRVSTMCGVLDRLQKRGLVEEHGTVYNESTQRQVKAYRAVLANQSEQ